MLKKDYPGLAKEWDYKRNNENGLHFEEVSPGSSKKAWWKCPICRGEYQSEIRSKALNGAKCPYCNKPHRVLFGYNDLAHLYPNLANEWNHEKNLKRPDEVYAKSPKKYWWKCQICKGEWCSSLFDRATKHTECPYCTFHKVLPGFNDFKTCHPELLGEWDFEKNTIKPDEIIGGGGNHFAWWKCVFGHSWRATISNRISGSGCPECQKKTQSSFPEQAILFYIKTEYPDAVNSYKNLFDKGMELDIFIPSKKIGIEYDGINWHKSERALLREKRKYDICKANGIKLIRIKENRRHTDNACDTLIYCDFDRINYGSLDKAIQELLKILKIDVNIDTKRDSLKIKEQYLSSIKNNSLQSKFPRIAKEWHPVKNGSLTPDMFDFGSIENVWWKCPTCKGEWRTTINLRTNQKTKCPFCSGRRALKGFSDLATMRPDLVLDWDYKKNDKSPEDVTRGSKYEVWWKCHKCGYEWKTKVGSRGVNNTGCMNCYKKRRGATKLVNITKI